MARFRANSWENHCFIFEAARNYHEEAFTTIKDFLADKQYWGADFNDAKYSSDAGLGGLKCLFSSFCWIWSPYGLEVYPLYAAVRLLLEKLKTRLIGVLNSLTIAFKWRRYPLLLTFKFISKLEKHHFQSSLVGFSRWNLDPQHDWAYPLSYLTNHQNQVQLPINRLAYDDWGSCCIAHMIQQPDQKLYQTWLDDASSIHDLLCHAPDCWHWIWGRKNSKLLNGRRPTRFQIHPIQTQLFQTHSRWRKPSGSEPNRNW